MPLNDTTRRAITNQFGADVAKDICDAVDTANEAAPEASKVSASGGSDVVLGDLNLTGFGDSPTIAIASGSNSARGAVSITVGSSPSPDPTLIIALTAGLYSATPFAIVQQTDERSPDANVTVDCSTSAIAIHLAGTPPDSAHYTFTYHVIA